MNSFPTIDLDAVPVSATKRRTSVHRNKGRKAGRQQAAWLVSSLILCLVAAGAYAFYELGKAPAKKRGPKAVKGAVTSSPGVKARPKSSTKKPPPQKAVAAKSITAEQFDSVPQGALRFRVEDIFGSPLEATHDFDEVERFGSNGEIFGSEFVNTFVLAYRIADRPGRIALFIFQGNSTNPPMVEKRIQGE